MIQTGTASLVAFLGIPDKVKANTHCVVADVLRMLRTSTDSMETSLHNLALSKEDSTASSLIRIAF